MKKIVSKVFLIMLLLLPVGVLADMGAPEIKSYELIVTNPDGVDYYTDYSKTTTSHIDKDAEVTVNYGSNDGYNITINETGKSGYLNTLDGLTIKKDKLDPEEALGSGISKYDTKHKALVYAKDGVDVLTGPASAYSKVTHLKKGTELEFEYYSGAEGIVYIYVKTDDGNGWIDILNEKVLIENDSQYLFAYDVETECGVIPKNTIIRPTYRTDMWSRKALFNYEGCETLQYTFRSEKIFNINKSKHLANVVLNIYKDTDSDSEIIGTIPSGAEFYSYGGVSTYEGADKDIYYVKYGDSFGYIYPQDGETTYIDYIEEVEDITNYKAKAEEPKKEEPKKVEPKKEEKKDDNGLSSETIVIICVIGGLTLALGTLVTIILVNKKKKNKVENVKDSNE